MKVVVLTTRLFDQPCSGGEICTARLLAELRRVGHDLVVIGRGEPGAVAPSGMRVHSVGPLVPPFEDWPWARQAASMLRALLTGHASTVSRLLEGGASARVHEALSSLDLSDIDAVVVDHLQAYAWIEAVWLDLPAPMIVMHNLESDGYVDRALGKGGAQAGSWLRRAIYRREARLLAGLEHRALRAAAVAACLSETDAQRLREMAAVLAANTPVEVLPGFPMRSPSLPDSAGSAKLETPHQPTRRIGMIGTWTWGPNREALHWMLNHVVPHLPQRCQLVLAGTGMEGLALPIGTEVLGKVDHPGRLYERVDVVAIPSIQGSGVQEKAIEAIASGRLVVGTSHAFRGLSPGLPKSAHIADEPTTFARLCAELEISTGSAHKASVEQWVLQRRLRYTAAVGRCLQLCAASDQL